MKRIIASPRLCTLVDISVQRSPDSDILMPKGSATVPAMYRRYLGLCMHAHERVYARGLRAPNIRTVNHSAHLLIIEDEPPCEIGPVLEGARGVTGSKLDQALSGGRLSAKMYVLAFIWRPTSAGTIREIVNLDESRSSTCLFDIFHVFIRHTTHRDTSRRCLLTEILAGSRKSNPLFGF